MAKSTHASKALETLRDFDALPDWVLVTLPVVMALFAVSKSTVDRWASSGRLPRRAHSRGETLERRNHSQGDEGWGGSAPCPTTNPTSDRVIAWDGAGSDLRGQSSHCWPPAFELIAQQDQGCGASSQAAALDGRRRT
jgi:hypothetical protein